MHMLQLILGLMLTVIQVAPAGLESQWVMDNGLIKTPQESVSGGLENEFVILVIVLGAVAILAIIMLAKRKKKSDSENN